MTSIAEKSFLSGPKQEGEASNFGARGYACVAIHEPKNALNIGSILRASSCYQAALIVVGGRRYGRAATDTQKTWKHTPLLEVDDVRIALPKGCVPVAVDIVEGARALCDYTHPERAFYVFGGEDRTLGEDVLSWCRDVIYIPTHGCMNLAAAVNVVLYDRMAKARGRGSALSATQKRTTLDAASPQVNNRGGSQGVQRESVRSTDWLGCPFCGGKVEHHYSGSSDWDIDCQTEGCKAQVTFWVRGGDEPERARQLWNRRAC
jgi:tRNA(Leu) C34 or U34 (ribose-2'-O)-methylase TrmL